MFLPVSLSSSLFYLSIPLPLSSFSICTLDSSLPFSIHYSPSLSLSLDFPPSLSISLTPLPLSPLSLSPFPSLPISLTLHLSPPSQSHSLLSLSLSPSLPPLSLPFVPFSSLLPTQFYDFMIWIRISFLQISH